MILFKFIRHCWKKTLCYLVTGSTAIFIAACYGMPYYIFGHWVITVNNKQNKPVKGLSVSICQYVGVDDNTPDTIYTGITDSAGMIQTTLETFDKKALHRHDAVIRDRYSADTIHYRDTLITKEAGDSSVVIINND
jgi:hypothetical protein